MTRQYFIVTLVVLGLLSLTAIGCTPKSDTGTPSGNAGASTGDGDATPVKKIDKAPAYPDPKASEESFTASATDPLTGDSWENLVGVIQTNKGRIKMKFFHDTAPRHVENFVYLARKGFFDGLIFHRYVDGFVIQGGDPTGTGSSGPGYTIPAEISDKHNHDKTAVASARTPNDVNPERRSNGSQWYICLEAANNLDGEYTVWGKVIEGMAVALDLRKGDVMESITIRQKK